MKAGHPDRRYAAVWASDPRFEATPSYGLDPADHLRRGRELAAQGYRPVSLSVTRTTPEGPPVTASVWHRPWSSEQAKDELAERQARAAVALVRLGQADEVWPLLRHSPDPRLRSFIVNWLNPLGADPEIVARRARPAGSSAHRHAPTRPRRQRQDGHHPLPPRDLDAAGADPGPGDVWDRRALPRRAEPLIAKLLDLYRARPRRRHPRRGGVDAAAVEARGEARGRRCRAEPAQGRGDRRWYVNSQGQTFALDRRPGRVPHGLTTQRAGSDPDETPHRR